MNVTALMTALMLSATAAPEITELYPTPLALGATIDVTGSNFEPDQTSVALISDLDPLATPHPQTLVYVLENNVRFVVSKSMAVGSATLRVTTSAGSVDAPVEVVPEPPLIASVSPDPVVLGQLVTLNGTALDSVESVTLGTLGCAITAQNVSLIVCETQAAAELIGAEVEMTVSGPFGDDTLLVTTVPPMPSVESLAPNPVRQGDLLTVTGEILPYLVSATIANQEAIIVEATDGQLVLAVPANTPPGAAEVIVSIDTQSSAPAGPLWIELADPDRPHVEAVYPSVVVNGGTAWAVGTGLDGLSWSSDNVTYDACDDKACRLTFEEGPEGPVTASMGGPEGTAVVSVQRLDDTGQARPTLTGTEPNPAFVGETLSLFGEDLYDVTHVVIGGVVQPIDYLGSDEIRVTVSDLTPRGAERAFVAGASASDALTLTVLDPFPTPDEPDVTSADEDAGASEGDAGPGVEDDATTATESDGSDLTATDASSDGPPAEDTEPPTITDEGDSGAGCASAPSANPLAWLILAGLMMMAVARRREVV
ncbi:MAG: IPT/TIG domain-containing protein [Myxococcota bacterium]